MTPMELTLARGWQRILAAAYAKSHSIDTIEVQAKWDSEKRFADWHAKQWDEFYLPMLKDLQENGENSATYRYFGGDE